MAMSRLPGRAVLEAFAIGFEEFATINKVGNRQYQRVPFVGAPVVREVEHGGAGTAFPQR